MYLVGGICTVVIGVPCLQLAGHVFLKYQDDVRKYGDHSFSALPFGIMLAGKAQFLVPAVLLVVGFSLAAMSYLAFARAGRLFRGSDAA